MSVDGFWEKHWNRTMDFFLYRIVIIFHLFSSAEQATFSILLPVDTTKIHLALIMETDPSDGRLWKWCSPKVTKAIFWGHMFFQKCSFCSSRLRTDFPLRLNRPETKKCTLRWGHGVWVSSRLSSCPLCLHIVSARPPPTMCVPVHACVFTHVPTHVRYFSFLVSVCQSVFTSVSLFLFGYSAFRSWLPYVIYLRLHRPWERPWIAVTSNIPGWNSWEWSQQPLA